jgi:hypothetical protein
MMYMAIYANQYNHNVINHVSNQHHHNSSSNHSHHHSHD